MKLGAIGARSMAPWLLIRLQTSYRLGHDTTQTDSTHIRLLALQPDLLYTAK